MGSWGAIWGNGGQYGVMEGNMGPQRQYGIRGAIWGHGGAIWGHRGNMGSQGQYGVMEGQYGVMGGQYGVMGGGLGFWGGGIYLPIPQSHPVLDGGVGKEVVGEGGGSAHHVQHPGGQRRPPLF